MSEKNLETKEKPGRFLTIKDEIQRQPIKRFVDYIGPSGLWFILYYVSSLFIMIIINIARLGFSFEAIFGAPQYFAEIFINYGLNAGKIPAEPTDNTDELFIYMRIDHTNFLTSIAWIAAPMIIYVLGIMLLLLLNSGFPQPNYDFDYLLNFRFFHMYIPFLNEDKSGAFYFLIVWFPIILSTVVGAVLTRRIFKNQKQKNLNVIKILMFNLFIAWIIGLQMGTMTGVITINIWQSIRVIFTNATDNTGYVFTGQYHPNAIMITSWFINFIPLLFGSIWYAIYNKIENLIISFGSREKIDKPSKKAKKDKKD